MKERERERERERGKEKERFAYSIWAMANNLRMHHNKSNNFNIIWTLIRIGPTHLQRERALVVGQSSTIFALG